LYREGRERIGEGGRGSSYFALARKKTSWRVWSILTADAIDFTAAGEHAAILVRGSASTRNHE